MNQPALRALFSIGLIWAAGAEEQRGHRIMLLEPLAGSETAGGSAGREIGRIEGAARIAVPEGGSHVLVLTESGEVWAWGDNSAGQLGTGDVKPIAGWSRVEGLGKAVAIAAGAQHSMALLEDGTVWAWGANAMGQLGDGTLLPHLKPRPVPGLSGVISVAAGALISAVLKDDGSVWVFGSNWADVARGVPHRMMSRPERIRDLELRGEIRVESGRVIQRTPGLAQEILDRIGLASEADSAGRVMDAELGWALGWIEESASKDGSSSQSQEGGLGSAAGAAVTATEAERQKPAPRPLAVGDVTSISPTAATVGPMGGWGNVTVTTATPGDFGWNVTGVPSWLSIVKLASSFTWIAQPNATTQKRTATLSVGSATLSQTFTLTQLAAAATTIVQITGGEAHTLALKNDGTVLSWGSNSSGQLGNGTTTGRLIPGAVSSLTGVVAVAAGSSHSLALKNDGTVWAWGFNVYGQLGDGSTTSRTLPVQVSGLSAIVAIGAGEYHSFAINSSGTLYAWGNNLSGQLGDGSTTQRNTPVQITGVTGVLAIAGGSSHSIALKSDGTVWSWGYNTSGQLGDGTTTSRSTPAAVAGLSGMIAVKAGAIFSSALKNDGTVRTWGDNSYGQLGDGTTVNKTTPVTVSGLTSVVSIASGPRGYHLIALRSDGTARGWGYNSGGEVGDGTTASPKTTPVTVSGVSQGIAIGSGSFHSFALTGTGGLVAWGYNVSGQLGDNTTTNHAAAIETVNTSLLGVTPAVINTTANAGSKVVWVSAQSATSPWTATSNAAFLTVSAASGSGSAAVTVSWASNSVGFRSGTVTIAGYTVTVNQSNVSATGAVTGVAPSIANGVSPMGATGSVTVTTSVANDSTWTVTGVPAWLSIVKTDSGFLWIAAANPTTAARSATLTVGSGAASSNFVVNQNPAVSTSNAYAFFASRYHSLAAKTDGTLWAWGRNLNGSLGDGTTTQRQSPVRVQTLGGVQAVSGGDAHSVALKSDGTVWGWGYNLFGQLGDGTFTDKLTPVAVGGLTNVVAVSAGFYYTMALRSDGTVWTWGDGAYGQLGDGTFAARSTPVQVPTLTGIVAISAGWDHALALKNDGTVWAWGRNQLGQLGDGTYTQRSRPVLVRGLADIVGISGGAYHSVALKGDGTVWTWGYNNSGQLGDGTTIDRPTAAAVSGLANIRSAAAGTFHTMAVLLDGTARAWGYNIDGQLGDGTTTQRTAPVTVAGFTGAAVATHRGYQNLILKNDGTLWSWGWNGYGQIGDGTTTSRIAPVQVLDLGVTSVSPLSVTAFSGASSTAVWVHALTSTAPWSAVSNAAFLTVGTVSGSGSGPLTVSWTANGTGSPRVGTVTVGGQIVTVTQGTAAATGGVTTLNPVGDFSASTGGIGNVIVGTAVAGDTTWNVTGVPSWVKIVRNPTGFSWITSNNASASQRSATLTVGSASGTQSFTLIQNGRSLQDAFVALSGGDAYSVGLRNNGTVWAWGSNSFGQLGDGTLTSKTVPVFVRGLTNVISIAAAPNHSLALKSDGTVWAWGRNDAGQLGDGTTTNRSTPVQVSGLTNVVAIAAEVNHSVAVKSDGTVWSWGSNSSGQFGNGTIGTSSYVPVQATGFTGAVAVVASQARTSALKSDGTVWSWGYNLQGQLGDGTTTNRTTPVPVPGLTGVTALAARRFNTIALKNDGTVWGWGNNLNGQLGDGSTTLRYTPIQIPGLTAMSGVAAGTFFSLAVKSDGTVWGWGANGSGQVGDGTITQRQSPVQATGLTGMIAVAAGDSHSLALKNDGTVWGWGSNNSGQLGNGTVTSTPVGLQSPNFGSRVGAYNNGVWVLDKNGNFAWDGTSTDRLLYWSLGRPGEVFVVGDWNGDGKDEIGLYVDGTWQLDYDGDGLWNPAVDKLIYFGGPGYKPYVGDWNGDGKDDVGAYLNGIWILDWNGNFQWDGTATDRLIYWSLGRAGEIPILGDWNGDGKTKLGLYVDGTIQLDYNGNGIWEAGIDKLAYFGGPGYTPYVGDWDGNGTDNVGAYQNGTWILDWNGNFGWDGTVTDRLVYWSLGRANEIPILGDWNGNGQTKLGLYVDGTIQVDYDGNAVWNIAIDKLAYFGGPGQKPVVGKW